MLLTSIESMSDHGQESTCCHSTLSHVDDLDYFTKDIEKKFFIEDLEKIDFNKMNSLPLEECVKSSIFENDELSEFSEEFSFELLGVN